jgi:hypothetical protein
MERAGYAILFTLAVLWILATIGGMIAVFPAGLIGLVALLGIGLLFAKVLKDRLSNKEDDYYSKNVDQ